MKSQRPFLRNANFFPNNHVNFIDSAMFIRSHMILISFIFDFSVKLICILKSWHQIIGMTICISSFASLNFYYRFSYLANQISNRPFTFCSCSISVHIQNMDVRLLFWLSPILLQHSRLLNKWKIAVDILYLFIMCFLFYVGNVITSSQ